MKGIQIVTKWIITLSVVFASAWSTADTLKFSAKEVSSYGHIGGHPSLNFNEARDVELVIGEIESTLPGEPLDIQKLVVKFPYANDLVVTGFKLNQSGEYTAIVRNAWIYKAVVVTLRLNDFFYSEHRIDIRADILHSESNIDSAFSVSPDSNFQLFDAFAILENSNPKVLADRITFNYQDKPLTLKVYKDFKLGSVSEPVFDVNINWLGHGVADIVEAAYIPSSEIYNFSMVKVEVSELETGFPKLIFTAKDQFGGVFAFDKPLQDLLMNANLAY